MVQNLNLAEVNDHSMVAILEKHKQQLWEADSKEGLVLLVTKIFADNNLNTKASVRLLENMKKSKTFEKALYTLTNSMLCGYGLGLN